MKSVEINITRYILLLALVLPLMFAVRAFAASTGTVSATVTPQNISVAVSDGTVAYGTLDLSSSQSTISSGINDTQVATNDGNVTEDFNIRSTDATGGTTWTLAGSIGADQYTHSYCNTGGGAPDPCDSGATWNAMSTSYNTLTTAVAPAGTNRFDLQIGTPSSSSDFVQKSITVTIQAVQN